MRSDLDPLALKSVFGVPAPRRRAARALSPSRSTRTASSTCRRPRKLGLFVATWVLGVGAFQGLGLGFPVLGDGFGLRVRI